MDKLEYLTELENIDRDWVKYQCDIIDRTTMCLNAACEDLGSFFLTKGLLLIETDNNKYYYDPKSKVGIKPEYDKHVYLDTEYNSISAKIIYKTKSGILEYNKKIYYKFKDEEPEHVFNRFLNYTKNSPLYNMKQYLRREYPYEMRISDRFEKIKNLYE